MSYDAHDINFYVSSAAADLTLCDKIHFDANMRYLRLIQQSYFAHYEALKELAQDPSLLEAAEKSEWAKAASEQHAIDAEAWLKNARAVSDLINSLLNKQDWSHCKKPTYAGDQHPHTSKTLTEGMQLAIDTCDFDNYVRLRVQFELMQKDFLSSKHYQSSAPEYREPCSPKSATAEPVILNNVGVGVKPKEKFPVPSSSSPSAEESPTTSNDKTNGVKTGRVSIVKPPPYEKKRKKHAKRQPDDKSAGRMSPETARTVGTLIDIGVGVGLGRIGHRGRGGDDRNGEPRHTSPRAVPRD
jgi:hypothetical protein